MVPVLIATTNPGKLREILPLLGDLAIQLETLEDHPGIGEPEETGRTFAENAREKALYYARASGRLTVAEDSGLEIDALGGEPGIYSARYPGATYAEKFEHLYARLAQLGALNSAARFVCAAAVVRGGRILFEARGVVEGQIVTPPRGDHGFGYDPILFYPPYNATLGELEPSRKAEISHRGRAFAEVRAFLAAM